MGATWWLRAVSYRRSGVTSEGKLPLVGGCFKKRAVVRMSATQWLSDAAVLRLWWVLLCRTEMGGQKSPVKHAGFRKTRVRFRKTRVRFWKTRVRFPSASVRFPPPCAGFLRFMSFFGEGVEGGGFMAGCIVVAVMGGQKWDG